MHKILSLLSFSLILSINCFAQSLAQQLGFKLESRVVVAPESVFKMFVEAGMNTSNHALSGIEKAKVEKAFAALPPLHQRILNGHLHSISFMDNMPNTALTSPVLTLDGSKMFNITFRAGILNETVSEWATQKESTCFDQSGGEGYDVRIEAGDLDAFVYILLHEATHVLDAVLEITPHLENAEDLVKPTPFTNNIWHKLNMPKNNLTDSLLEKTRFRSGKKVASSLAPNVYKRLSETPFASLYGMASWSEDLAELESIYHLTKKMGQPFYIVIMKGGDEVFRFEPMKNKLVKRRFLYLRMFYQD